MHIKNLVISNFRGIQGVELRDLKRMVVIAGQNGSGKSCVFDAIRVLKSAYGGYHPNEFQQWLGEFQIRLKQSAADSSDFISMLHDRDKPAVIHCDFVLSDSERRYVVENAESLIRNCVNRDTAPNGPVRQAPSPFLDSRRASASQMAEYIASLVAEMEQETLEGRLDFEPHQLPGIRSSWALSSIFSTYIPEKLGIIDYHGPHRTYGREYVQNVNFDLTDKTNRLGQSSLYNYVQKYANVKSEMAASFVHEIIAREAGINKPAEVSLTDTLKELFTTFFPDKRFVGPTATASGTIAFDVELTSGAVHDIDELSSGEKEIVYGYLRIRNSAPKDSIVLIDEPELHLNPKLIRELPAFYSKHLAEIHNNQIWLITHSDSLLRESVAIEACSVFHMLPAGGAGGSSTQLRPLSSSPSDLQDALINLVGDLAAYHPSGKVVIFEGGGDADFDRRLVGSLFPALAREATLISATSKPRVTALHDLLDKISSETVLPFVFYSITDADTDSNVSAKVRFHRWDVYHIENYLLSPAHIRLALEEMGEVVVPSEPEILALLKKYAERAMKEVLRHLLTIYADQLITKQIKIACDPKSEDIGARLADALDSSFKRIDQLSKGELAKSVFEKTAVEQEEKLSEALSDGTWITKFPGRSILKLFVSNHTDVSYDVFRMLVVSQMRRTAYQPAGMKMVIDQIISA